MPILERLEDSLRVNHPVNLLRTNPRVHSAQDVSPSSPNEHSWSLPGLEKRVVFPRRLRLGLAFRHSQCGNQRPLYLARQDRMGGNESDLSRIWGALLRGRNYRGGSNNANL